MKYMISTAGAQRDFDAMVGRANDGPHWSPEDWAALSTFMTGFNEGLARSGELVETRGISAPSKAKRVRFAPGGAVVVDAPYSADEEVLAGYWIVEVATEARALEIARELMECPGPDGIRERASVDVRAVDEHQPEYTG